MSKTDNSIINNSNKNEQIKVAHKQTVISAYSSPLPPPQILSDYENISKGSAEIIIKNFEKQVDHRIDVDNKILFQRLLGQLFAFILYTFAFVCVVLAIIYNMPVLAGSICTVVIGSAIYSFLGLQKNPNKNKQSNK